VIKMLRAQGITLDLTNLPLDDAKTYELLSRKYFRYLPA